ncbi:transcriptional regulator, LysR family [Polaromonas sp. YR568]|uniref:LysR family transcriptional regulator n=1 Tax=Polaromonas sp. YR568 TaxID=1855301 RepID=UPI0008DF280B|nr:LysR family transcriptional regulator [Polaromonas sp. YR568]SFU67119.1 transcriptional regulator, LysR family [Polaromonas sp. YR568]
MTLAQLEVLITLDECRSFSRAAMRLGTTQSAVSHALRALETQFGVKLAQRDASGVTMTDAGERLLLRAREMTALAATMTQELGDAKELKTGTLRIGSFGPTSTVNLLPPLLAAFKKRHPGAQVRIEEESDEVIDGWLLQKRVELGFVVVPDERFEVLPLVQDEFVAILPAGHALAQHKAVPVSALTGLDFVLTEAGCGPVVVPILQKNIALPKVLYHFTQIISILQFVQQGLAVSVAARLALPDAPPGVVYRPLLPTQPRTVGLACLDVARLSPLARAFWDLAREQASARKAATDKPTARMRAKLALA